jgi:hypothetical protein
MTRNQTKSKFATNKISNTVGSGPLVFLAVYRRITLTFVTHHGSHDLYGYFIF